MRRHWAIGLVWSGIGCTETPSPDVDPVTGAAAVGTVEGVLSLAYSHDMQGETKPCG